MSKELKALHKLFGLAAYCNENVEGMNEKEMKEYDKKCENMKKIIEQDLIQKDKQAKILDILKSKKVNIANVFGVMTWYENDKEAYEKYNIYLTSSNTPQLTLDEYQILKEWLNDNQD